MRVEQTTSTADLDGIVALAEASFTNPWTRDALERELASGPVSRVYVARTADGRLVAFCACWVIGDELHINTLAVDPAERRQGIATLLLRKVFAASFADGARRATLEVRESNEAALGLYARLGFHVSARRPRYYSAPEEDALILWLDDLPAQS